MRSRTTNNRICLLLLYVVALIGCVPLDGSERTAPVTVPAPANAPARPDIQVEVAEPNRGEVISADEQRLVEFRSPKGFGNAQLSIDGSQPLGALTLRFHLQGLEQLRITTPERSLGASVSALDELFIMQEMAVIKGAGSDAAVMEPITDDSPYWLEIAVIPATSESSKDGFINVTIPALVMTEMQKGKTGAAMIVEWLDFYR